MGKGIINISCDNLCLSLLKSYRMASRKASTKSNKKDYTEGISIRALKRKRALGHYQRRNKGNEPYPLNEDLTNETTYYIDNGLRKVYPYYYQFRTYIKGRWFGKTLIDIYTKEFYQRGVSAQEEIENGKVTINGKKVALDLVLREQMLLEHKCHRHEMPVLDDPIEIIEDNAEILVINKPASIPVHPCGRYRYNSITMLLKHELGYENLRPLYRLDRLTSGVLIMPKTTSMSKKLEKQLEKKQLYKEYLSRVEGKFPDGDIVCNEALGCMSQRLSLIKVDPGGKPSSTTFTRLSYNGKTSVVKCVPHTGRTHQIRVHLQFLGFPIFNDPLYNSASFGPSKGKGGVIEKTPEEIETEIMKTSDIGKWIIGVNPRYTAKFGDKWNIASNTAGCTATVLEREASSSDDKVNAEDVQNQMGDTVSKEETLAADGDRRQVSDITEEISVDIEDVAKVCYRGAKEHDSCFVETVAEDIAEICNQLEPGSINQDANITDGCNKHEDTEGLARVSGRSESSRLEESNTLDSTNDRDEQQVKRVKVDAQSTQASELSQLEEGDRRQAEVQFTETSKYLLESSSQQVVENIKTCKTLTNMNSEQKECDESTVKITDMAMSVTDPQILDSKQLIQLTDVARVVTDPVLLDSKLTLDEFCEDCKYVYNNPKRSELILYLHAIRYKGPDWEYTTTPPYWASEDFDEEIPRDEMM